MTLGKQLCMVIVRSPGRQSFLSLYNSFTWKMVLNGLYLLVALENVLVDRSCQVIMIVLLGIWS